MRKFITRVQDWKQKATDIAAAVESAPGKAAELREAVLATAGQMQQMRRTIQGAATGLVANDEERLIAALHEIDQSTETFRAAGYDLEDVEMELALPQRLIIHLERIEDVPASALRSLADANASRPTTHAILTALLKAEDMADKVALENLQYHQLMVYIGQMPSVRLCWSASRTEEPSALNSPSTPPPIPASAGNPWLGQSSFFEQRAPFARATSTPPAPDVASASLLQSSLPATTPADSAPPAVTAKEDPLARFKKMPDLSRPRK